MSVGNPGPDHDASGGYLVRCVSRAAVGAHKCVASGIDLGMPLWGCEVTTTSQRYVGPDFRVDTDADYGWLPSAMRSCQQNGQFWIAGVDGIVRIHAFVVWLGAVLCVLVLGLSGCGASEIPGVADVGEPPPEEIPGIPAPGEPPPEEVPGVPPDGEQPPTETPASPPDGEIPGVTPAPFLPPPCVNPVGPFNSALCEALDTELDTIEARSPSDASDRLDFLASLSSSAVEAATQLENYDWLSGGAEGVFGGANSIRSTESPSSTR
jgi:hypothetical protein